MYAVHVSLGTAVVLVYYRIHIRLRTFTQGTYMLHWPLMWSALQLGMAAHTDPVRDKDQDEPAEWRRRKLERRCPMASQTHPQCPSCPLGSAAAWSRPRVWIRLLFSNGPLPALYRSILTLDSNLENRLASIDRNISRLADAVEKLVNILEKK